MSRQTIRNRKEELARQMEEIRRQQEILARQMEEADRQERQFQVDNEFVQQININTHTLIVGKVQMGKTMVIIDQAINAINQGFDVLILVNCLSQDLRQLFGRFSKRITVDGVIDEVNDDTNYEGLGKIYVALANASRIKKFLRDYPEDRQLYPIIDEADLFTVPDGTADYNETQKQMLNLFQSAFVVGSMRVTATPQAFLNMVDNLAPITRSNIHVLPLPNDYLTVDSGIEFINREIPTGKWSETLSNSIDEMLNRLHEEGDVLRGIINTSSMNHHHEEISRKIDEIYGDRVMVAVLNQENRGVKIKNIKKFTDNPRLWIIASKGFALQDFYSFAQKNFRSIPFILVSGRMLGRGLSPRSEVMNFKSVDDIIYANVMFYACAKNRPGDEILQSGLRISGRYPGMSRKLYLVCSEFALDNIRGHMKQLDRDIEAVIASADEDPRLSVTPLHNKKMTNVSSKKKVGVNPRHRTCDGQIYANSLARDKHDRECGVQRGTVIKSSGHLVKKIMDVLREKPWTTCANIYSSRPNDYWNLTTTSPVNTIAERLTVMFRNGIVDRRGTPFEYNIKA